MTKRFLFRLALGSILAAELLWPAGADALTVRVVATNGVPQIVVNGQPTLARIFYGGLGWEPIHVDAGDQTISADFTAVDDDKAAQLSFGFDPLPASLVLDDIHVIDLADNREISPADAAAGTDGTWFFSPANAANRSGEVQILPGTGLHGSTQAQVILRAPATGTWSDTHVYIKTGYPLEKGHHYRVNFHVKSDAAQAISVVLYRPHRDQEYQILGAGHEPFFSQLQLAAKSNVNLVTCRLDVPWPHPGETMDLSYTDAVCDYILAANPNALIIPRININAPVWWIEAHPDDEMRWQGKKKNKTRAATIASAVYQQEAKAHLTEFIDHLESRYGEHMAGYHIAGGNSNEWFYEDSHSAALQGYAPADTTNWRLWLAKHYPNDAALQAAWNDPTVTLSTAQVPSDASRRAPGDGIFFDPVRDRAVMDWNQYQQDTMAGFVCDLAHLVRTETHGNKLVLFFYGYLFEFAALQMGPSSSGHLGLRQVLDCPDIDILCAPISYYDRGTDGSGPSMTVSESVALAGKLWVQEDDTSTHKSLTYINPPGSKDRTHSMDETLQVVLRNGAQAAIRNMGTWWMDLCRNGWFDDPALWSAFSPFLKVEADLLHDRQPFHPEVAAVFDEPSLLLLSPHSYAVGEPIFVSRAALGRMGAPYGQYLQDDVMAGRVPDAKLYIFLDAWRLTADQRAQLREQTRGKTCLWMYAPGYWDGDKASLDPMKEQTGFQVQTATPASLLVTPSQTGEQLGLKTPYGQPAGPIPNPLFAAADAQPNEILATFPDGSAAVAMRQSADGISIFSGSPTLTPELLRVAATAAGVHLYTHSDAAVYANDHVLAIHATDDGPLQIDTGHDGDVVNAMTGASVGRGPQLNLNIAKGQTLILRY